MKPPRLLFILLVSLLAFFVLDLPAVQKKTSPKSSSARSGAAKASSKNGRKRPATARSPRRLTQQQPDEPRVREIQQALVDKGYNLEVNGNWDPQSIEALKKFQEDKNINNLTGRGKLDSLTLIALGLGPKREPPPESHAPHEKAPTEGKIP